MEERKDSDCSSLVWSISLCNIRYIRLVDAGAPKWLFTWSPQMAKLATGYCHKLSWSSLMPWSSSGRKLDDGRKLWFTLQNSSIRLTRQYIPPHFDLSLNWHSPYFFMDYLRVLPLSPICFFFWNQKITTFGQESGSEELMSRRVALSFSVLNDGHLGSKLSITRRPCHKAHPASASKKTWNYRCRPQTY